MSKLSREQIKELTAKSYLYSKLYLKCDGFRITVVEFRSKNKIMSTLYVNGNLDGKWLTPKAEYPESKFYPFMRLRVKKNIFNPKCKKMETKIRERRDMGFASVGQVLRHLNKVCDSVEVVED